MLDRIEPDVASYIVTCWSEWGRLIDDVAKQLYDMCPKSATIHDPKLLVNASLQKEVMEHPKKAEVSTAIRALAEARDSLKPLSSSFGADAANVCERASEAVSFGKTCVGTDFVLNKILNCAPEQAVDVPGFATDLLAKMRSKRITLPKSLQQTLEKMQDTDTTT